MKRLTRDDLHARLQCSAENSNVTQPATTEVLVDLSFPPLSVTILGSHLTPMTAQWNYSLVCRSQGSRPAANITWWLDGERLRGQADAVSKDGSVTTSTVPFRPETRDHGRQLVCRAENSHVTPAAMEARRLLDVRYPPTVKISLGKALDPTGIREGTDVYFECSITANPAAFTVTWLHNGEKLQPSLRPGTGDQVTINARSLVIRNLTRSAAGSYACTAVNPEGSGESPPVQLSVQYAPVCSPGQRLQYAVTLHQTTRVTCQVEAVPPEVTYRWQFNSSLETLDLPFSMSSAHGLSSTVSYTPTTELDFGQLLCTAENKIGRAAAPCVFDVVLAGPPSAPANCSLLNQTSESLLVACSGGGPGHGDSTTAGARERSFVAELYAVPDGRLLQNVSSPVPSFELRRLPAGLELRLELYAVNRHGRSAAVLLDGFSLKAAEKRMRAETEDRAESGVPLTPALACLAGAAVSLVLVTVGAVIYTRNSRRRSHHTVADRSSDQHILQKALSSGFERGMDDAEAEPARGGGGGGSRERPAVRVERRTPAADDVREHSHLAAALLSSQHESIV
ncbi:nephrin-like [Amphibalanus amphitrite]|uniref:nephrin-like n=1 Tax=Amphibalanus amphitrite TaxID=1232801 RepID=UPI001C90EE0D|nr:nephrin-like [Amphibalanus amphitrite]